MRLSISFFGIEVFSIGSATEYPNSDEFVHLGGDFTADADAIDVAAYGFSSGGDYGDI